MSNSPSSRPIRVLAISLGCPKNRVDTERLLGALETSGGPGAVAVDDPEQADLLLVNTCGFIRPAIEESVSTILELAQAAGEADTRPVLAVAGCLVSRFGADLSAELPEVDLWLSTHELADWPERVAAALGRPVPGPLARTLSTGPAHAYLKVGEGCSHNCRFCTIPSIRGPHVSAPLDDLVAEARAILAQGVPEIILVGQDLTAYGSDLGRANGLLELFDALLPLADEGLRRLRPMYLYPAGLTDELLSFMAQAGEPLLPYFDVPLQHAHPDILSAMGRPFARDPRRVIDRIRKHLPQAALRTTLISGFPGETEEHHKALLDFVAQARFHHLGVFPYYPEEGTPGATMDGQVDEETKQARADEIMELQQAVSREIMEGYVGETLDILVEEPSDEWPGLFTGRAWFQAPEVDGVTYVSADPEAVEQPEPGRIIAAEITEAKTYDLIALA